MRNRWLSKFGRGLLTGAVSALIVLGLWQLNWFINARLSLSNVFYVPMPTSGDVVLVAIDDPTLDAFGSPLTWSRSHYADALNTLAEDGARVVAFDMLFSEPRDSDGDSAFAGALLGAREAGVRTVLATSGGERLTSEAGLVTFRDALTPIAPLAEAADYVAYVNAYPDADGLLRREIGFGAVADETPRPSLVLASYLSYFNLSPTLATQVVTREADTLTLPPDVVLPLDENGMWMQQYFGAGGESFSTYSFVDVARGETERGTFTDKIVLVGLMNATGAVDVYPTPLSRSGETMAGVEVQANAIETLLAGVPLRDDPTRVQVMSILVLAIVMGVIGGLTRWHWTLLAGGLMWGGWFVFTSWRVSTLHIVPNALHPTLAVWLATLASIGVQTSVEIVRRQRAENLLQSLVQLSQQRMKIERIMPLIADDVREMSHAPRGAVWFAQPDRAQLQLCEHWGGEAQYAGEVGVARVRKGTVVNGGIVAVPVVWQGEVLAVLVVAERRSVSRSVRRQLERFARRIAPNLDNVRLYAQTESQFQLLDGILAESPAGIIVLDAERHVLHINTAASTTLSAAQSIATGIPFAQILTESAIEPAQAEQIAAAFDRAEPFRYEVKLAERTYQLDAHPMRSDGRWIMTLGDISDLAELNQLKTRMIRMASHDLKNPLGRIIGYGEMLQDADDDEPERRALFIDRMLTSAHEMLNIITEILDLEHVKSGQVQMEPLSMANVARNVIERHTTDMDDRKQTFEADIAPDLPRIAGNYNLLVQACSNLLGNASKYTPEGGHIALRLTHQPDTHTLRLEITDNGYGMPAEAQAKLFTEFYRVRTSKTRNIKGTGLGLSLVKSVIEAHQGKIWVTSELDKGSTFTVELPALPPSS